MASAKNNNSALYYVINVVLVYALWKAFSYYVKHSDGVMHGLWADFIYALGSVYAGATSRVLNLFSENTVHNGINVVYPVFNKIISVEDHCLGIPATIIFIAAIAFFQGSWKNKLWFIPLGVLLIVIINFTRLVLLCYIFAHYSRAFYDINHSLVYVIATYTLIFLMIVLWMKRFAGTEEA